MNKALIALFLFILLFPAQSFASGQTILPIWRKMSEPTSEHFVDALRIVKEVNADRTFVSLWGWERLEPKKGKTRLAAEIAGLDYAISQGFKPYFGITVIDTVKRVMPKDLQKINWRDPYLLIRYTQVVELLAQEMPQEAEYFVIANEVDVYLGKHPEEVESFLYFATAARDIVRKHFPRARIGVTVTYEGLASGGDRKKLVKKLISVSDAAFFTYYPQSRMIFAPPPETPSHLDMIVAAAGHKDVILQEVGYPSAGKNSSPQRQAEFFKIVIPEIAKRPKIIFSSIFALHDFDEKSCDMFVGYYGMKMFVLLSEEGKEFRNFLCSLGLHNSEGVAKPAWHEVVSGFENLKSQQ